MHRIRTPGATGPVLLRADSAFCGRKVVAAARAHGLLRASFVPPEPIRQLRDLTRARTHITQGRTKEIQRLEKLLESSGIKLSSVATDITGVSGRLMLQARDGR